MKVQVPGPSTLLVELTFHLIPSAFFLTVEAPWFWSYVPIPVNVKPSGQGWVRGTESGFSGGLVVGVRALVIDRRHGIKMCNIRRTKMAA